MIYGTQMNAGADPTALNSTNTTYTFGASNTGNGLGVLGTSISSAGVSGTGPIGVYGNGTGVGVSGEGVNAGVSGGGQTTGLGLYGWGGRAQMRLEPKVGSSGPPTSGSHHPGEVFVDGKGRHFLCVAPGTPGTWVRPGLNAVNPFRVCDTRSGTGTPYSTGTKLGAGANLLIKIAGEAGVPVPEGATSIVANLTVTGPTGTSYLTAYPANIAAPTASNINLWPGRASPTRSLSPWTTPVLSGSATTPAASTSSSTSPASSSDRSD